MRLSSRAVVVASFQALLPTPIDSHDALTTPVFQTLAEFHLLMLAFVSLSFSCSCSWFPHCQLMMLGAAPRQTTSNLGHLRKPSIQALIHNLNRHYYSINIDYRKNELEQKMLLNLHKKK